MRDLTPHASRLTPHASRLTLGLILLSFRLFAQPTTAPCGVDVTSADFQAAQQFENSVNPIAPSMTTEASIPLRIIYVYEDNGEPIRQTWRISEEVDRANQAFDGFLNFYICGYHHINSSNFTAYNHPADQQGLYDSYHDEDAVNVYIVRSITTPHMTPNGLGIMPIQPQPNNMIWLAASVPSYVLAHELGHYFGLPHTHVNRYVGPNACLLVDPQNDYDGIPDTPADPGPAFGFCPQECPIATTPCTLTCNINNPPVTYTYVGYLTNNVMSYHGVCTSQEFTPGQIDKMSFYLNNHPTRSFLLTTQTACNNDIAEDGYIYKYCSTSTPAPSIIPIKEIRVDMTNELTGWQNISTYFTNLEGKYVNFQEDFSNLAHVTIRPKKTHPLAWMLLDDPTAVPPNYRPTNGVTASDLVLINRHILNIQPLPAPYAWVAADANNSGSMTTFDIVTIRKVILGLEYDFPAGTWRYVPEHYFENSTFKSGFLSNPFSASYAGLTYSNYMDKVTLDMDDASAAEEETWSFRAIKVGDVNCNMNVDEFAPGGGGDELITVSSGGANCVNVSDVITLEVNATSAHTLLGYQLGIRYDENGLQFLGASSGNLPDFSQDNFAPNEGQIRTLWYKNNAQPESLTSQRTLFKLHFKVLDDFCNILDVLSLDDEVLGNMAYDQSGESVSAAVTFNYQSEQPTGTFTSVYPNPANNSVAFNFQINQSSTVEIRLSDYLGNTLTHNESYLSGTHSHTFNNLSSLSNGALNYWVTIGGIGYSGILIKSQE